MTSKKVINLIQGNTEKISFPQLLELRQEYVKHINENPFPSPPHNPSAIDIIVFLKRKDARTPVKIGPYENITVFEAANRIASDLVLINGVIQIIEDGVEQPEHKITLHLGTKHVKDKGDFLIGEKHGEAFNVAESFYASKLQKTFEKWKGSHLSYILVNQDVVNEKKVSSIQRESGTFIIGVKMWDSIAPLTDYRS
jgi:hypothetical protein